ncbi:MAG: Holliday junction resolvase RuvX [Holosporaceae bacterium]|nr:Holliday junction resolvase RuvX [Holosporaceae bacterium]
MEFIFLENIAIDELSREESVLIGLDVGDKTVGIAISDRRNKIASSVATIARKGNDSDFRELLKHLCSYKVGLIVCGWPVQMNGMVSKQCEKVQDFIEKLSTYTEASFAKWDERFSTSVVDKIMIAADLSRKKRKQLIDKTAAAYILQGALDFLNRRTVELTKNNHC